MNPKPAVLALLACCSSAFALIGEDAKQIEGRYGKPMRVVAEHGNYRHVGYASHGFMILVEFLDGISKGEEFTRPDKSNLSSDVVKQILALSADKDQTWRDLHQRTAIDSGVDQTARRWLFSRPKAISSLCKIQILLSRNRSNQSMKPTALFAVVP